MTFSDNLKRLRKAAGLSQEQLALACGWSGQSRIANYESASGSAREPKLSELPLMARALGVSVSTLLGEEEFAPAFSLRQGPPPRASHSQRPDPLILAQTQEFLETAYALQGKTFSMRADADLFADAYEWLVEDERPVDQRNLVDFGRWLAARQQASEEGEDEQSRRATSQAAGKNRRSAAG